MPSSSGSGSQGGNKESVMKNYNNYLQMNAKQQAQAKQNAHAMNILRNVRSLTPDK